MSCLRGWKAYLGRCMGGGVAIAGVPIVLGAACCGQGRQGPVGVSHVDGQLGTRPADPAHP